jgi:hypothetical protein
MKKFDELTEEQKTKAIEKTLIEILEDIVNGSIRFNDELNQDDLQARIDKAFDKAEKMRTPWFSHEYILETCREDLESLAICQAEDMIYLEQNEFAVRGVD